MLIIIEGPDGAGKSTLAAKLSKDLGYTRVHCGETIRDFDEFLRFIKQGNLVMDRAWYSEMVYGKKLRLKSELDFKDMIGLEVTADAHGGLMVIYCRADIETLWERCDETFSKATLLQLLNEYDDLMLNKHHKVPVMVYDTSM